MKNVEFIAIALVLSMVLMGAGYAAWISTTTVTMNVQSGTLDMQVTTVGKSTGGPLNVHTVDVTNVATHSYTVTAKNLYPANGETGKFGVNPTFKNVGSIPAKFGSVEFDFGGHANNQLVKDLRVGYTTWQDLGNDVYIPTVNWITLGELNAKLQELYPGEYAKNNTVSIPLEFKIADGSGNDSQGQNVSFTMKWNWKQATN